MHIHLKNKKENLLSQLGENGLLSTVQKCPRQIVMKTSAPKCSPTPTAAMARGPHVRSSIRISGSSSENGWGSNAASCARWALPAAPSGSEKNRRPASRTAMKCTPGPVLLSVFTMYPRRDCDTAGSVSRAQTPPHRSPNSLDPSRSNCDAYVVSVPSRAVISEKMRWCSHILTVPGERHRASVLRALRKPHAVASVRDPRAA